jgi:hypothetical protein
MSKSGSKGKRRTPVGESPKAAAAEDFDPHRAFRFAWNTVSSLEEAWLLVHVLYCHSEHRVRRFQRACPKVFEALRYIVWDFVAVQIAKLLDGPGAGTRQNLSLERFINDHPKLGDTTRGLEFVSRVGEIRITSAAIYDHRRKVAAHADFRTAIGLDDPPHVIRKTVDDTVAALATLFTEIAEAIGENIGTFDREHYDCELGTVEAALRLADEVRRTERDRYLHARADAETPDSPR